MFELLSRTLRALLSTLASRASREAEIFVLRQQLLVLSRKSRARVRLRNLDRLVLVWLYRLFPSLLDAIIIVKPETGRGFAASSRFSGVLKMPAAKCPPLQVITEGTPTAGWAIG